jgi:hypothetical protein
VTFRVNVFEVVLPFFGVTVMVTLHDPTFKPLNLVFDTLQNLADLGRTLSVNFEVEKTFNPAKVAIDLAVPNFFIVILGIEMVVIVLFGFTIFGKVADGSTPRGDALFALFTEKSFQLDQLPAPSLTRI